jgi:hypothetical protein
MGQSVTTGAANGIVRRDSLWPWRFALVTWMGAIFLMSSGLFASALSADSTESLFGFLNYVVRKLGHLTEYAILAFLWFRSLGRGTDRFTGRRIAADVLAVAYAATDEYHQSLVPERSGKASDLLFDGAGAMAAMLALDWVRGRGGDRMRATVLGREESEKEQAGK